MATLRPDSAEKAPKNPEKATAEQWGAKLSPAEFALVKHANGFPVGKLLTEAEWAKAVKTANEEPIR